MENFSLILAIVVVTALAFDFTNGFHDTANAMATTISTGALKPKVAVAMSAVLNLVGAFLSVEVANTISKGLVDETGIRPEVIFAALVGAILWNLLTWLVGLPSSSSHALMGGLIGATIASAGVGAVHGDVLVTYLGGWRIIRTMGKGLTDLQPQQGFAAQTSAATVILASSHLGFSLSTTHSVSGSVMGAGLGRKGGVVRWSTATRMFVAWGLTLPAAALVGALAEYVTGFGAWGTALVAVFLVASSAAIWKLSRREIVDHTNVNETDE